jgi:hypothetical protein
MLNGNVHIHRLKNMLSGNLTYSFLRFLIYDSIKRCYPCNRPWRPTGLWDVDAPTFSRQSAHRWQWGCQPYAIAAQPNPSSRTMALGSTEPLKEMSTRNLPGSKGRPARKSDTLTATCEPTVLKIWEPRRFTTLWASTSCYGDSLTFYNYCQYTLKCSKNKFITYLQAYICVL